MREFSITVSIAASAERIWRVMEDVERWPEWTSSILSVERLTGPTLGVGAPVRIRQPQMRPAIWTVTQWQPGKMFVWVSKVPGLKAVAEHIISPEGAGCSVTLRVRYEGVLSPIIGVLLGTMTNRYLGFKAEGLKRRSEEPRAV